MDIEFWLKKFRHAQNKVWINPDKISGFFCLVYRCWWRVADARSLVCVGRAAAALS